MGADTLVQRSELKTADRALQTVGGVLLLICMGISGWALTKVNDHDGRLIRVETKADGVDKTLGEIKETLNEIMRRLPSRRGE